MARFDCDNVGDVTEYTGCKVESDEKEISIKFIQPLMIQSFKDEYKATNKERSTPAELGSVLVKSDERKRVNAKRYTYYCSGLEKLLHVER